MILEVACFNLKSAITAVAAGADRIELCEEYTAGGVTPSEELIRQVKDQVNVPVHIMIRPRGGDFVYSEQEIADMEASVLYCWQLGLSGVVFGALTATGEIDTATCRRLIQLARPMAVTFHRSIDHCKDLEQSMKTLLDLGVERVLSSGKGATALEGLTELSSLQARYGRQIIIMPGGGIRSSNIVSLLSSGCSEYHTAAITSGTDADAQEVKNIKALLANVSQ